MIFRRSSPRHYADYHDYRPFLRIDFQHLCAYCLRHEHHIGGEANIEIDHHCPVSICPDRETEYPNLYLSCAECNGKKRETWPTALHLSRGPRSLDPCREDHDEHWNFSENGHLTAKTAIGNYTIDKIGLDRESLNYHRSKILKAIKKAKSVLRSLHDPLLTEKEREEHFERFEECMEFLQPPVFPKAVYSKKSSEQ